MNFASCISDGMVKKLRPDTIRAKSLFKSSFQAIATSRIIPLNKNTTKTILRELYEGLREYCEGLGYMRGYKFTDHESIGYFLKDVLEEQSVRKKFDRYRKLRNGINYYGDDVDVETVKEALKEIPSILQELKKHSEVK